MAIKFSQFNERTDHTSGMYLVGYDGNQNIHITVDNLFDDFINGTENTITMFGTGGTVLADSILSQDTGATILTVSGQLNVDAAATFDTSITVTGDSTLNGNVTLGDASADLITQTGTLYLNGPVKDTTNTLGVVDQVLLSDATGELTFTDLADLHVGGAEVVELPVKNVQGSALVKGDPVYISGSVGASGRLEVQLADASNTLKMPAVGLLKQDLANNAEGFAVVTGKLRNLITDPIDGVSPTENDVIYIKPSGTSGAALTTTKPVYGNFIQNIGKVGRVSTSNDGNFVVSSILRTNDIPNLTPGRLWVGSTGNTIESQTIFVDEATGEVGIGTASPSYTADIVGTLRSAGQAVFSDLGPVSVAQLGGGSSTTSQFNIISTAGGGSFISATNRLVVKANNKDAIEINNAGQLQFGEYGSGAFTGTVAKNLSIDSSGNVIETNPAVDGSGTLNYVTKWTPDGNSLGNSIIFDNGSQVAIGTTSPAASVKLHVEGALRVNGGNLNVTNTSLPIIYLNTSSSSTDNYALQNSGGNFQVKNNAGLGQIQFQILNSGQAKLDLYGQNTFTGTAAKNLSVTSSGAIIETDVTAYDLSGYGTNNGTAGVQLVGSDSSTDQVAITGAGTTSVTHSGNTITVTSNDQYTGTVTGSGAATVIGGQIPYWNSTTNITGTSQLNYSTVAGDGVVGIGNSSTAFSGSRLVVGSGNGNSLMTLYGGSNSTNIIAFANGTSANAQYRGQVRYNLQNDNLEFLTNGETFSRVYVDSAFDLNLVERTLNFRNSFPYAVGAYVDLPTDNELSIGTNGSERLRIGSAGQIGIGGASYGASGQVLTSSGSSSAPSWQTPATGGITGVTAGNALTGGGTSGTVTINLSTEGPGAGTYGSSSDSTKIDTITIDAYGRIQGLITGTTGSMSSWTIKEGNGTESTSVTNGETLTIAQGTGIQSEMTSTSSGGTITITNTAPDTGTPAVLSNGSTPSLNTGISASEMRSLIGAGTGSGDITGVTAGSYMTGGGTSGTVTLNANASTSATANTLAARDSSGDIYARLFRATYSNQSTISGAMAFRVNNGSDNYTRYCSNPTAIRTFIGAGTSSFSGSYNDLSNKPTIPTNNNQLTNGAGYITSSGVAAKIKAGGTGPSTENLNTVANSVSVGQLEYRGFSLASSNAPAVSDNANGVITVGQHSGNYNAQVAFSSNGNIYWRDNPSSSFGSWRKMWDEGNDGSGSGLDADTVDGVQGSSFLRSDTADYFTGKLAAADTNIRRAGIYGIYDSTRIGHIWSMGTGYAIPDNGADFGNLYGLAYKHTNNSTGGTMGGSHQMVWCNNGSPRGSIGYNSVWHTESIKAPIFIDSANTNYYADPFGTSVFKNLTLRNDNTQGYYDSKIEFRNNSNSLGSHIQYISNSGFTGYRFYIPASGATTSNVQYELEDRELTFQSGTMHLKNNIVNSTTHSQTGASLINTPALKVYQRATNISYTYKDLVTFHSTSNATQIGSIRVNAYATQYATSSDYRLKENEIPIADGIQRVKQLQPKRFNFIGYSEQSVDGFMAHEVQDVIHEAVSGVKDEVDEEGNPVYQSIDQSKLVPLLTAALQDAITKIEDLETRIQTLENQ